VRITYLPFDDTKPCQPIAHFVPPVLDFWNILDGMKKIVDTLVPDYAIEGNIDIRLPAFKLELATHKWHHDCSLHLHRPYDAVEDAFAEDQCYAMLTWTNVAPTEYAKAWCGARACRPGPRIIANEYDVMLVHNKAILHRPPPTINDERGRWFARIHLSRRETAHLVSTLQQVQPVACRPV
jgi:hypothetical protein